MSDNLVFLRATLLALVLAGAADVPAWAAPAPETFKPGVRIRFLVPNRKVPAFNLGYADQDLITRIDGRAIESADELRRLEWLAPNVTVRLTVATTTGLEVARPAPTDWTGLGLRENDLLAWRYATHYRAAHSEQWDKLVIDGLQFYEQGRYVNAEVELRKALAKGAHDALTSTTLGVLAQRSIAKARPARWDDSRRWLTQAVEYFEQSPDDRATRVVALYHLALCLEQVQDAAGARALLEKARELDRHDANVLARLLPHYKDKPEDRLLALNEFLTVFPGHPNFWDLKMKTLSDLFRFSEMLAALKERIRLYPTSVAAHRAYLDELLNRHDNRAAMTQIEAMLRQFDESQLPKKTQLDLKLKFCELAREAGQEKKAMAYAEDIAKERGTAHDWELLARAYTSQRRWKDAAAAFKEYGDKMSRGNPYLLMKAQQAVEDDLDRVVLQLSAEDLYKYGFKERAENLRRLKKDRREGYVLLRQYGPPVVKFGLWGGAILLALGIVIKLLNRRSAY